MKTVSSRLQTFKNDVRNYPKSSKVKNAGALWGMLIVIVILLILTTLLWFVLISKSFDATLREPEAVRASSSRVSEQYEGIETQTVPAVPTFPE